MAPVPPGNQTGFYYIIVAGLPFQCSWQRLKDFARDQQADGLYINIDHALVYPESTDGWVRVRGKSDFQRVLAHLNGGIFDGRSLLADGRNETQWVNLRDYAISVSPSRTRNDSTSTNEPMSPSCYQYQDRRPSFSTYSGQDLLVDASAFSPSSHADTSQWNYNEQNAGGNYSPISPAFSNISYFAQTTPALIPVYKNPSPCPSEYYSIPTPPGGMVLAGNMAPSTPVYFPTAQPVYPYVAQMPYINPPTPQPSGSYQTSVTSNPNVTFETRKIVITGLPRSITESELGDLLGQQYSSKSRHRGAVQSLEVARYPDGSPKGHAFVVLETHEIARRLVGRLDKLKFQGRELKARLAKEGADRGYGDGVGMQDHVRQYTPPADDYHLPSLAENGIEQDVAGLMGELTLAPSTSFISRERSKDKQERSSSRSTEKERERKSKKENREEKAMKSSAPLVVDGSGGRGKRRR